MARKRKKLNFWETGSSGSSAAEVVAREKSLQWWRARMAGTLHYVEAVEAALGRTCKTE